MNMSRKTMIVLLLLTVFFTAGTILVQNSARPELTDTRELAYYLTAMDSPRQVLAVVVENDTGSLTIVHSGDEWLTDTALPGVGPDVQAAEALFSAVSRIRMNGKVEGADPADPQFGLTDPAAVILVEDQEENGIEFRIGSKTPDGSAYYVCASGGSEVFTLSADYEQALLGDVSRYLDLRVFAGLDLSGLTSLAVSDQDQVRFSLAQSGSGNVTGMKYYSLTQPVCLPLAASLCTEKILAPMEELRARTVLEGAPDADKKPADLILTLQTEDAGERIYAVRWTGDAAMVEDPAGGVTYEVPGGQLDWMRADAAGLLGGKLLSLNTGETEQITLEAGGGSVCYTLSGGGGQPEVKKDGAVIPAAGFTSQILDSLNRITIYGIDKDSTEDTAETEEVLRCTILTGRGEQETKLVFRAADERKCRVSVNGQEAFICDRSSLQPLIEAAAGA